MKASQPVCQRSGSYIARNFDGTDDEINYGSDASVDDIFAATPFTGSVSFWVKRGATGFHAIVGKNVDSTEVGWLVFFRGPGGGSKVEFKKMWTTIGYWDTTSAFTSTTALTHIAVTYNGSATTNDPVFYVNGVLDATLEQAAPTGTIQSDAANDLKAGETHDNEADLNGVLGWLCVGATIWTAADVNRARWWGRPFGGLKVYHPLMTDKLGNEGTATANGTATGTTVVSLPVPAVRPGTAMMGLGVGW